MQEHAADLRTLVEELARLLADSPDQVSVTPVEQEGETVLEVRVAESDLGKLIGRQGRTARALRTIVSAAGARFQERYSLEIIE